MKIDLSTINREEFNVTPHTIAGDECFLVCPKHIGAHWSKDNLWQRSSVWTKDGVPVSLSFPKFFNWEEHPEIYAQPTSLDNCQLIEKLDGSLLAVSRYKGQLIVRTRGTVDATKLDNGHEIEMLKAKYPSVFAIGYPDETSTYTYIFEWVSPLNKIVLDYGSEPNIYLIGIIAHEDYSLASQSTLNTIAQSLGVERPRTYSFDTIPEMISGVEAFKGVEGICVYYNDGQLIRKLKGVEYLARHRFKEHATIENTIDLYFSYGRPDYQAFMAKLVEVFDYECANMVLGFASQICDGMKEVVTTVDFMKSKVESLRLLSRKEAALNILQAYGGEKNNKAGMAFKLLDNRELNDDDIKKLLYQILKK